MSVTGWLLAGDPAVRWQVMRDVLHEPADVVAQERARVAVEGWGASLLDRQQPAGFWGGDDERRTWMTTIYTLVLLKDLGVDPAAPACRAALERLNGHVTWWQLDGRPFFEGETEPCINGAILAAGAYFGQPTDVLAQRLVDAQLDDGGWNCNAPPSTRSSFHTTICVLEGLLAHERASGSGAGVRQARERGEHYLVARRMYRSLTSGDVVDRRFTRYAFPTTWHYDVLRGLDHLRNAGAPPDARVGEALDVVARRRHQNGRWPLNVDHGDRIPFDLEPGVGKASRWNTLRALRVLEWGGREA